MPSGLPRTVTIRWRLEPLDLGRPALVDQLGQARQLDQPDRRRRQGQLVQAGGRRPVGGLGAEPDVVLLVAVAELRHRHAADQDPERVGDDADRDAQVARRLAVDDHLDLGLAERERRVEVHQPRLLLELRRRAGRRSRTSLAQVGTGQVDLERLRPATALERRDVVDAGAEVGVILEQLARLLLDGELGVVAVLQVLHPDVDRPPGDVPLPLDDPAAAGLADRREQVHGPLQLLEPRLQLGQAGGWSAPGCSPRAW